MDACKEERFAGWRAYQDNFRLVHAPEIAYTLSEMSCWALSRIPVARRGADRRPVAGMLRRVQCFPDSSPPDAQGLGIDSAQPGPQSLPAGGEKLARGLGRMAQMT